jgi:glycerol uptake facilitator-like aquaporin
MASVTLARRLTAEALGTALLLAAAVGSGIQGDRLAGGNQGVALLAHSIATAATLGTLILILKPISGADFNPAVSVVRAFKGELAWRDVPSYIVVQLAGAFVGVAAANLMFEEPIFSTAQHVRAGGGQVFSEFIATFGLLAVILGGARLRSSLSPFAVGAYIAGASWFTASNSFANPAVTLARAATNTAPGIRPEDAPGFIIAQVAGAFAATLLFGWLLSPDPERPEPS